MIKKLVKAIAVAATLAGLFSLLTAKQITSVLAQTPNKNNSTLNKFSGKLIGLKTIMLNIIAASKLPTTSGNLRVLVLSDNQPLKGAPISQPAKTMEQANAAWCEEIA